VFGRSAFESLDRVLGELESGDWAALVITGKPYFFSAGADLDELSRASQELAREGSRTGHELFGRIQALPYPTVAAINGACLGGGVELGPALRCAQRSRPWFAISPAPNVCSGSFPAGAEPSSSRGSSGPRPQSNSSLRARSARTGCSTAAGARARLADRLLEPAEFVDESIGYAVELVTRPPEPRPGVRPPDTPLADVFQQARARWTTPSTAPRRLPTGRST